MCWDTSEQSAQESCISKPAEVTHFSKEWLSTPAAVEIIPELQNTKKQASF